jgi:replicative DNA helicase
LTITNSDEDSFSQYSGEDQVVTSYELRDKLLSEKKTPHVSIKSGIPGIDYACEGFRDGELIVISGPTKNGKCHGKGTKILMFDGSVKAVEDINVGEKLMGDDSTPRVVLSTTVGFGKIYKVTPNKCGEAFTCNEDHILCLKRTMTKKNRKDGRKPDRLAGTIVEISLKDYLQQSKTRKHILKCYQVPVEFPEKKIEIPAYILGVWLGDGSSNSAEFTSADDGIISEIKKYANKNGFTVSQTIQPQNKSSIYRLCHSQKGRIGSIPFNRFKEQLKTYNLLNNKHIPRDYKINSRQIRLDLLAGIIDTDGNTIQRGTLGNGVEITQKNKQLAEDICFLARSLGFAASLKKVTKKIKSIGFEGEYYRIGLNGDTADIPCIEKRKLFGAYKCKRDILRHGFTVEYIGEGNYYGFQIDKNCRYLLADFQVTHNTLLAQSFTVNFSKQKEYPGWFSYEVPARQFLDQFSSLPLFYLPQKNKAQDFNWLQERCLEAYFKYNTRVFFIDHLHYLIDMARIKNPSLDIGTIVRRIKRFAVDNDFVIFLLAHIGKNESEDLSYRDLRDSSFISQESDCVIMIKRTPKEGQNTARARVEFHRRTGVMERIVNLEKKNGYLCEVIKDE